MLRFTGACTIKLFTVVIVVESQKARVFATLILVHPGLIFAGKAGAYQKGAPCHTPLSNPCPHTLD